MSTEPVCISHDADIAILARVMVERHLRSVPVMDGDHLVGIVTRRDLLRTLSRSDAEMTEHIRKNLSALGRASRWTVRVEDGHAVLQDEYTSAVDRHVAKALAESVPGVLSAIVIGREPMPANDIES